MKAERGLDGLLLIDKPEGPTSHRIVASVRRLTGQRRIGHAGTLDPMASGLLPLVLGPATRLVRFLPQAPKVYEGRFRWGIATTTDDVTGEVVARHDGPPPGEELVRRAATRFRGRLLQSPPAVSARKVGGKRLYRLAREGRPTSAPPRDVEIFRLDLEPTPEPFEWAFRAEVSSGTYVRSIARDLGAALGTGGALAALRRLAIGPLSVGDAVRLPEPHGDPGVLISSIVPVDAMPLVPPVVRLDDSDARRFTSGLEVDLDAPPPAEGPCRFLGPGGALLGIGLVSGRLARPKVVLPQSGAPDCRVVSSARKNNGKE